MASLLLLRLRTRGGFWKCPYGYSAGQVTGSGATGDACLQNTLTGLTIGNCYTVSVWAAEAGGSVHNLAGNPGVMTMEFQNGSNFEYGRYFLPNNPAWSDSALTTIPWAQYSYTFTANATSFTFWVSANGYNGVTSYIVADDVTITPVICGAVTYDYGDLPTAYNTTGGGTAANAPRHQIGATGTLRLGSTIDAEANGQPSSTATGDDLATGPDEDGVTFPTLVAGSAATVVVKVSGPNTGKLNAWIDWNNNGSFADAGEQIASNVTMTGGAWNAPGANNLSVTPPAGAVKGTPLAARFRLSLAGSDAATTGTAVSGEIEDYMVVVTGTDWGDLPDTGAGTAANNYNTLSTDSGPSHSIINSLKLGATVDPEAGTLQNGTATADDASNTGSADDEDGVDFTGVTFTQGATATLPVTVTLIGGGTAKLNAFFDWNNDGDFLDTGEALTQVSVTVPVGGSTVVSLSVPVPAGATVGANHGARFRLSTAGTALSTGSAADGEVEDYLVTVLGTDYGDLPDTGAGTSADNYETLLASGGARHVLSNSLMLGSTVDADTGLLQGAGATADDTTNTGSADDEDGVNFTGVTFVQGLNSTLPVTVSLTGGGTVKLNAFFDWNNNGSFADSGEAITELSVVVPVGGSTTVNLSVPVPATATVAANHGARFRISTAGGLTSVGSAPDGEVEDYVFSVVAPTVRLGNRVWADTDNSGTINGAEVGINGVTVQVYAADASGNPTGSVLATTTTATATLLGYYAFNLLPGDYVVVIPASNFGAGQPLVGLYSSGTSTGTFNGIDPDTTPTDSDDNGFNAINPASTGVRSAAVTLTVAGEPTGEDSNNGLGGLLDNSVNFTVDFGFVNAAPTAIKLGYVKGWWTAGQVTVEWETVSELETLGFDLYRLEGGKRMRVNADLVPALNVERGGVYRVTEAMTKPTGPLSYLLVEQEITGKLIEYGPFTVLVQSGASVSSVDAKGGALEFRFSGEPGATYQVESTGDMVHGRWTRVGSATADADGVLLFHQPVGGSDPVRFYRALKP